MYIMIRDYLMLENIIEIEEDILIMKIILIILEEDTEWEEGKNE